MNEIKTIPIGELDDSGWQKYHRLSHLIAAKNCYTDIHDQETGSWNEFKNERLRDNIVHSAYRNRECLICHNDSPEAWAAFKRYKNSAAFIFDTHYHEVPEKVLKAVYSELVNFMGKEKFDSAFYWSFDKSGCSAIRNSGAQIYEEMLLSRLEREDMDKDLYDRIISNTDITGMSCRFCSEFPVDNADDFTHLMNEIFEDMASVNPFKIGVTVSNSDDWIKKYNTEKQSGSRLKMLMLFDNSGKIAAYCSLFVDPDDPVTIRHGGGFTVVDRKHRGKGLARFMKAKLYRMLLEENSKFRFITTDTMPWNKYMYRINEEFGFKQYEKGYTFKLTKKFILDYLSI